MTATWRFTAGLVLFLIVATANSGGYRYGVSDQAFYIPAVESRVHPDLFPRDRAILAPQMRLWIGDEILGLATAWSGLTLPVEFAVLYVVTMMLLATGAMVLARRLGYGWWTAAACLVLLALRHRIAKTGANSLEGYFHPRMLAFACGTLSLGALLGRRPRLAWIGVGLAAVVHPTTALWFAVVVGVALLRLSIERRTGTFPKWLPVVAGGVSLAMLQVWPRFHPVAIMDDTWLAVLESKDYLFPSGWPAYAWVTNLAYVAVIAVCFGIRARRGLATPNERALVTGLLSLALLFFVTWPATESRWAFFVQLQVNRVFWVLDFVTVLYASWWLSDRLNLRRWPSLEKLLVATMLVVAIGRGFYILRIETHRPLVSVDLPSDDWTQTMRWLRTQPVEWHVLADPGHAWKYGSSVRVAAMKDTLVEAGKDTAFAMYDRGVALRVAERLEATTQFDDLDFAGLRQLQQRYGLDVFVDRSDRAWPLRRLYANDSFVVYDLR